MCLFLFIPFLVNPHIHRSIIISFTFNLFSWLFVVDHVSTPYSNDGITTVLYIFPYSFTGIYLSLHSTSSNVPILYSSYVVYPYTYIRSHPSLLEGVHLFNYCPDIFARCRSTLSACSNRHSIRCVFVLLTLIPLSSNAFLHDSRNYVMSTALPPHWTKSSAKGIDSCPSFSL